MRLYLQQHTATMQATALSAMYAGYNTEIYLSSDTGLQYKQQHSIAE
jgi:hypothetical protein